MVSASAVLLCVVIICCFHSRVKERAGCLLALGQPQLLLDARTEPSFLAQFGFSSSGMVRRSQTPRGLFAQLMERASEQRRITKLDSGVEDQVELRPFGASHLVSWSVRLLLGTSHRVVCTGYINNSDASQIFLDTLQSRGIDSEY